MTGPGDRIEIEWVDAAPTPPAADDVIHNRPPRPTGRTGWARWTHWNWWYAIVAAVIVIAVLVATRPSHHSPNASASPSPSSSTSAPRSPSAPAAPLGASSNPSISLAPSAPPVVTQRTGPLLDVPASWVLFGRASEAVIRIELAGGELTTTAIPLLSSTGPASFLAGPDRAIVRPLDVSAGYVVPDDQPFQLLASAFPNFGPALPGPDGGHLWVPNSQGTAMNLVDFTGRPSGETITLPTPIDTGAVTSDDAGYLLFSGTGGEYDARPSGITRITTGSVLAGGPNTWVVYECDANYHCAITVIDRASGARHPLNVSATAFGQGGLISPDGKTAAVLEGEQNVPVTLHLINLATGADRATTFTLDPNLDYQDGLFVWSPDSHYLFTTNGTGRLYAIDAPANRATALAVTVGPISQIALRTG